MGKPKETGYRRGNIKTKIMEEIAESTFQASLRVE